MTVVRELRLVLTVEDFDDAAVAFYRDALGLEEAHAWEAQAGRIAILAAGNATLELVDEAQASAIDTIEVGRRVGGPVRIALEVADSAELGERLREAGAEVLGGPVETPWNDRNVRLRARRHAADALQRPRVRAYLLLLLVFATGCGDGGSARLWTVEQAESITSIRGTPVRVRECRGLGGENGRYERFRCLASARTAFDRYDTVGVFYVLHPLGEYDGPGSKHRLSNVRFLGGPGVP